jgi:hypothetical protein
MTNDELRAAAERRRELARAYAQRAAKLRDEAQRIATIAARLERQREKPKADGR